MQWLEDNVIQGSRFLYHPRTKVSYQKWIMCFVLKHLFLRTSPGSAVAGIVSSLYVAFGESICQMNKCNVNVT